MKSVLVKDQFFSQAGRLRGFFEEAFRDSREAHSKRFVWDYWHVEDQYRLIRTPAFHYFPARIYQDLHSQLVQWGREFLGCHDISPPWLSYYVEGCRQELHADVPHGPWAFVYSISPKKLKFRGGETTILNEQVLDYWPQFDAHRDHEQNSFVTKIAPKFNRLVVFDPRSPHGVSEVEGVTDPLEARLVIHGWFVKPRPYVVGGLSAVAVEKTISRALSESSVSFSGLGLLHGTTALRMNISRGGEVLSWKILSHTLRGLENNHLQQQAFRSWLRGFVKALKFSKARTPSAVTLPLIFE